MEKVHEPRELNTQAFARGVWLVKVPKYLANKWETAGPGEEVGQLAISKKKVPGTKAEISFTLSEELANGNGEEEPVPREHDFVLSSRGGQTLCIFSSEPDKDVVLPPDETFPPEKVVIEGRVNQRVECRPRIDDRYSALKRKINISKQQPGRKIVQLDKIVQNHKPKAYQVHDLPDRKKGGDEKKRARLEKDQVNELLFNAFEKHQYYNIKDLVRITQQPINYLKEVLKEICNYNMKAPHRNMWELKREYRHYKEEEEEKK